MTKIGLYGLAFLLATVKFLFAASIVSTTSLTPVEIAISTGLGALFSFNLFYWSSSFFIKRALDKKIRDMRNGTYKPKATFTKMNKWLVKLKKSKSGFWLICIFAPLLLSVPIGSIIVAKFYFEKKITYLFTSGYILIWAFLLAYLNEFIFMMFQ